MFENQVIRHPANSIRREEGLRKNNKNRVRFLLYSRLPCEKVGIVQ